MGVTSNKYIIQNIERISAYDLENGALMFAVDDLQEAQMTNEQETVYATGKNGVKIGSADRNKASKFTATNGAIVDGVIAAQVGSDVVKGKYVVPDYMETLVVSASGSSQIAKTTYTAVGTTGAEIAYVYKRNTDGTVGEKFPIAAAATATTFAYDPATQVITLPTGKFNVGENIVVIYDIEVDNAKKIENAEDKYSETMKVVFDIFAKDICTEKSYYGKIVYPKGKISGNFDLSFGNDPSTQSLEIEALSGGCSGSSKVLWDMFIFDDSEITKI